MHVRCINRHVSIAYFCYLYRFLKKSRFCITGTKTKRVLMLLNWRNSSKPKLSQKKEKNEREELNERYFTSETSWEDFPTVKTGYVHGIERLQWTDDGIAGKVEYEIFEILLSHVKSHPNLVYCNSNDCDVFWLRRNIFA